MVIINTAGGSTRCFDLTDPTQADLLNVAIAQGDVTAISLKSFGSTPCVLTAPKKFQGAHLFGANVIVDSNNILVAEQVYLQVENVRVALTLSLKNGLIRCDLAHTGRLRYNPHVR